MDMNVGLLPAHPTKDQCVIYYMHGRVPDDWGRVLDTFDDDNLIRFLKAFHSGSDKRMPVPDEYAQRVSSRHPITDMTKHIQERLQTWLAFEEESRT